MGKLWKIPVLVSHTIPIWDPAKANNLYFTFSLPIKIFVCGNLTFKKFFFCYLYAETELPKVAKDSLIPIFCLHCSNIKLFNIYGACNYECTFSPLDFYGCSLLAPFSLLDYFPFIFLFHCPFGLLKNLLVFLCFSPYLSDSTVYNLQWQYYPLPFLSSCVFSVLSISMCLKFFLPSLNWPSYKNFKASLTYLLLSYLYLIG